MKRVIILFGVFLLLIVLIGVGRSNTQASNISKSDLALIDLPLTGLPITGLPMTPILSITATNAFVKQSGPQYFHSKGPHNFHMEVKATVHHWLFAYIQATRIHYEIWKPGNYNVKKKLYAISNEPIKVTISGVNNLVHAEDPTLPSIYHWVGLSKNSLDQLTEQLPYILQTAIPDIVDPAVGFREPVWSEPEPLLAITEWTPGTRMPQEVSKKLALITPPIGEEPILQSQDGLAPVIDYSIVVDEATMMTDGDIGMLRDIPQQFGDPPTAATPGNAFVLDAWLRDGISVAIGNRSYNYEDPQGYEVTVTADPAYPHS